MKIILYFLGICVILGVVLSIVVSFMPAFSYAAKGFLISVEGGYYEQAYEMLSEDLRRQFSLEAFKQKVHESGLDQYQSVVWEKEIVNKETKSGYVVGIITTKQNKKIPMQFDFIHIKGAHWTEGGWYINNIHPPASTSTQSLERVR